MQNIPRTEIKLGDIVQCFGGAYGTGTVTQVTPTEIVVTRPYLHVSDVEYTGGLLAYTGLEVIRYPSDARWHRAKNGSPMTFVVYSRMETK